MAAGNNTVAITAGSGTSISCYADGSGNEFQRVFAAPEDSQKATYSAVYKAQSAGTGATTNVFTIAGSATKTVKVTKLSIVGTAATAAAYFDVVLNRQSTADSGGTAATAATIVKYDTNNASATAAAPLFYTAAPTAGTVTGALNIGKIFCPITGTPASGITPLDIVGFTFRPIQAITLRGVADVLAVTFNGATPANVTSLDVMVEWTESGD